MAEEEDGGGGGGGSGGERGEAKGGEGAAATRARALSTSGAYAQQPENKSGADQPTRSQLNRPKRKQMPCWSVHSGALAAATRPDIAPSCHLGLASSFY